VFSWKRGQRWIVLIASAAWCSLLVKGVRKLLKGDGNDFTIIYSATERWASGDPIYDGSYMYPPFFVLLLGPLVIFPVQIAGVIWLIAKIPIFHFSASVLVRAARIPESWRFSAIGLAPVIVYRMLDSDCATGNVNVMLLGAVALAVHWLQSGKESKAGIALGAMAAVKLAPAYLIVALAVARRGKLALSGVLAMTLFLVVPCFMVHEGLGGSFERFLNTSNAVFVPGEIGDGGSGYVPGQSLRALSHRLLRPIDATAHDQGRHVTINVLDTSAATAELTYRGLAALLALAGLFWVRRREPAEVIALALIVMLLVSPYSRKAHFVLLLPAYCICLGLLGARLYGVSSWAVIQLTTRSVWGKATAALFVAYCPFAFGSALLIPVLLRRAAPSSRGDPGLAAEGTSSPDAPEGPPRFSDLK